MSTDTAAEALIARWITPHPDRLDYADARVLPRYVSVWAVVGQFALDNDNVDAVAEQYELPREAVEAAVAYYHRHHAAIDARLAANRPLSAS